MKTAKVLLVSAILLLLASCGPKSDNDEKLLYFIDSFSATSVNESTTLQYEFHLFNGGEQRVIHLESKKIPGLKQGDMVMYNATRHKLNKLAKNSTLENVSGTLVIAIIVGLVIGLIQWIDIHNKKSLIIDLKEEIERIESQMRR